MTKSSDISDEEKKLFRDSLSQIKPIKSKLHADKKQKIILAQKQARRVAAEAEETAKPILFSQDEADVSGDSIISFAHAGLQRRKMMRLKQGKVCIEATLDLHGYTVDEAVVATDNFLARCQKRKYHAVSIIHGKGYSSPENKPLLKNAINNYLRSHAAVLAFHSAKNREGGTGAIVVMLKHGN